jgi:predicted nucleotide-binding protein
MNEHLKIFQIADELETQSKQNPITEIQAVEDAANEVGKSWSGSWLGYHARVYYENLQPIPPGARFSKEWGFTELYAIEGTVGNWVECDSDEIINEILRLSGIENIDSLDTEANQTREKFDEAQAMLLSLLSPFSDTDQSDSFLSDLIDKIKKEKVFSIADYVKYYRPSGQQMSRDMNAIQSGLHTPPHILVLSRTASIKGSYTSCATLSKYARRAASHIENLTKKDIESERVGTNVFIGHGRSSSWRDLKDFIQDRLHLPWDEFNRVPVAGFTNIARLSEMLDNAAIAFIVMTAEDEQADGKLHARMNVIHEAGLFQGRLGFEKAILILEEGCEEFSNVQGLGQIRFPAGNISAKFEEIRQVLEREGLVE